jgi:hypothetical protein
MDSFPYDLLRGKTVGIAKLLARLCCSEISVSGSAYLAIIDCLVLFY